LGGSTVLKITFASTLRKKEKYEINPQRDYFLK
jgi:hypothetical protein